MGAHAAVGTRRKGYRVPFFVILSAIIPFYDHGYQPLALGMVEEVAASDPWAQLLLVPRTEMENLTWFLSLVFVMTQASNRRSWRWGWVEIAAAPADLPGSSCCVPEKNVKGTQDELRDDLPILL